MDRVKREVEQAARKLGASSVRWEGGKHRRAIISFPGGRIEVMSVSNCSTIDPYKTRGWLRQRLRHFGGRR